MIVIATNNGKNYILNILSDLERIGIKEEISIIDTQSSDNSFLFIKEIIDEKKFNLNISLYQTPYKGFDTGAYIYAINNFITDRFYFLQDSIRIKNKNFFLEIDKKIKTGTVIPIITFQENFYANHQQINFCINNFETSNYKKGIFGPMFSILYDDVKKIDKKLLVYPYDKNTQMAMERGWSIIFDKYNFNIEPLEGEKNDEKINNDSYYYFSKIFPYRL